MNGAEMAYSKMNQRGATMKRRTFMGAIAGAVGCLLGLKADEPEEGPQQTGQNTGFDSSMYLGIPLGTAWMHDEYIVVHHRDGTFKAYTAEAMHNTPPERTGSGVAMRERQGRGCNG